MKRDLPHAQTQSTLKVYDPLSKEYKKIQLTDWKN